MTKRDPHEQSDFSAWTEIIDAFAAESDRAAVILAAAKLDELLAELLRSVLQPSPLAQDELFDTERPLSTFSAKIHLAHRLGLFDPAFARALHLVRRIRNSFAHETAKAQFDQSPHRDRIRELAALWDSPEDLDSIGLILANGPFKGRPQASVLFHAAVGSLIARLQHMIRGIPRIKPPRSENLEAREAKRHLGKSPGAEGG
jgi:hypothetical protein